MLERDVGLVRLGLQRPRDDRLPLVLEGREVGLVPFQFCFQRVRRLGQHTSSLGFHPATSGNAPSRRSRHFRSFLAMMLSKSAFCSNKVEGVGAAALEVAAEVVEPDVAESAGEG